MKEKHLYVRVTPKASSNKVSVDPLLDGTKHYRIYVTCAPENGKANKAVIELLAKELGVSKSSLSIKQGHKSRDKIIVLAH